jgi:hypothetical protein
MLETSYMPSRPLTLLRRIWERSTHCRPLTRNRLQAGVRAQAMVEFTLTLMLFLALVLGIFDLGRAAWAYNMVSEAARAGARAGMVHENDSIQFGPNNRDYRGGGQ